MARLIGSTQVQFETDFAIVHAMQRGLDMPADAGSFAAGGRAGIGMMAGNKYANVDIRLERWDAEPPYQPGWEDRDEVPFEEDPSDGPLRAQGFDPIHDAGLSVSGLGRARARILARGRHDYVGGYGGETGEHTETWLVQLYPDPVDGGTDYLLLEPRVIASGGDRRISSPWTSALYAWRSTGWQAAIATPGFSSLEQALWRVREPATFETIRAAGYQIGALTDPLPGVDLDGAAGDYAREQTVRAARLSGLPSVATWADLIEVLTRAGLVVPWERDGEVLLVLNPTPGLAWEQPGLFADEAKHLRWAAAGRYITEGRDIANVLFSGLKPRPRRASIAQLSVRLAMSHDEVRVGLQFLALNGLIIRPSPDDVGPFDVLELVIGPGGIPA